MQDGSFISYSLLSFLHVNYCKHKHGRNANRYPKDKGCVEVVKKDSKAFFETYILFLRTRRSIRAAKMQKYSK